MHPIVALFLVGAVVGVPAGALLIRAAGARALFGLVALPAALLLVPASAHFTALLFWLIFKIVFRMVTLPFAFAADSPDLLMVMPWVITGVVTGLALVLISAPLWERRPANEFTANTLRVLLASLVGLIGALFIYWGAGQPADPDDTKVYDAYVNRFLDSEHESAWDGWFPDRMIAAYDDDLKSGRYNGRGYTASDYAGWLRWHYRTPITLMLILIGGSSLGVILVQRARVPAADSDRS